jgi:hypothetical protein
VLSCSRVFNRSIADYIYDKEPVTNTYISVPPKLGHLNCAAFIAGIVNGILDGAGFVRVALCWIAAAAHTNTQTHTQHTKHTHTHTQTCVFYICSSPQHRNNTQ